MKKHIFVWMLGLTLSAFGPMACTSYPSFPMSAAPDCFLPEGGHVQGLAATEKTLFVSQKKFLSKMDWRGNLLKRIPVPDHTGDICWFDNALYAVLSLKDTLDGSSYGKIHVYDADLNLIREKTVDRGMDGITCLDGILYVGMGAATAPSKEPHRVNILGRFDARTLEEIAPRFDFDYGYQTRYGFQDLANDGQLLYASFYAVKDAPDLVVFDTKMQVKALHRAEVNQGFDRLPASWIGERKTVFLRAISLRTKTPPSLSCSFDTLSFIHSLWTEDRF